MQYPTDSFQACYVFYSYIRCLISSAAAAERRTLFSRLENYVESLTRLGPAHTVHGLWAYLESETPTAFSSRHVLHVELWNWRRGFARAKICMGQDARSSRLP